jgi:hypothetical protein
MSQAFESSSPLAGPPTPKAVAKLNYGWRIARDKLTVTFSDGDRRLMGMAYRKAKSIM